MSNMKQVYDKSAEEFDEKFVPMLRAFVRQPSETATEKEIKSFLKHHTLALIDAENKRTEELRVDIEREVIDPLIDTSKKNFGESEAIDRLREIMRDHLTYLKEQREIISNS